MRILPVAVSMIVLLAITTANAETKEQKIARLNAAIIKAQAVVDRLVKELDALDSSKDRAPQKVKKDSIENEIPKAKKAILETADDPTSVSFVGFNNLGLMTCKSPDHFGDVYYAIEVSYRAKNKVGAIVLMENAVLFEVADTHDLTKPIEPVGVVSPRLLGPPDLVDQLDNFFNPASALKGFKK